jgi:hypothetical protein
MPTANSTTQGFVATQETLVSVITVGRKWQICAIETIEAVPFGTCMQSTQDHLALGDTQEIGGNQCVIVELCVAFDRRDNVVLDVAAYSIE